MSKIIELQLIDPGAGEAILRVGQDWYMVSVDRGWTPIKLEALGSVLRWIHMGSPRLRAQEYFSLEEAVQDVRRICLAALREPETSHSQVRRVLEKQGIYVAVPAVDHLPEEIPDWVRQDGQTSQDLIAAYCGRLDRLFMNFGISRGDSLDLSAKAFRSAVEELHSCPTRIDFEIRLFELASTYCQKEIAKKEGREPKSFAPHIDKTSSAGIPIADRFSFVTLDEDTEYLHLLPRGDLRCLALWSELDIDVNAIRTITRRPSSAILDILQGATKHFKCSLDELKDPVFNYLCKRELGSA